ncbi:MAG: Type 1 glutamine amidotransferase-like domain-containing protein [Proteobacteria bacterium]|nr:Type 1 glutamine amidotransferase-like domain-containing protein [Pseudomonadota bacterium]
MTGEFIRKNAVRVVLLGPQRMAPILDQAFSLLDVEGNVAVITAGWQEREAEDQELTNALGRPGINLKLYARSDEVFRDDPELFEANRVKQDFLKQLQELYRRRLTHAMAAARQMQRLAHSDSVASGEVVVPHLSRAIAMVRQLDDEHAAQVEARIGQFHTEWKPSERPAVARQRAEIQAILDQCEAVAIAGGHVVALLNRMRLFGLQATLAQLPIVAWSAGAMVLTERIILFHDSPPQGRGDAEVLGNGLGLIPGLVALPNARRRLLLDDRQRIALFARRVAPAHCVALDERCWLHYTSGQAWRAGPTTRQLTESGQCVVIEAV